MTGVKILFWFDVEDYITPASEEALLGLLNLLESRNIQGIFKLVGEKARQLRNHGRTDILQKLDGHEVGYHTDLHSQHPTVSEYLEPLGFQSGVLEFAHREAKGLQDLTDITGKASMCYGQPGGAWAPQTFAVLRSWGIPVYMDSHDQISLEGKPFWYGGVLNYTDIKTTMRMELVDGGLEQAKNQFDQFYKELCGEDGGFVSIYYHPCEFATTEFWDGCNFARGNQPPREQWKPAALRSAGEMEHYLEQLGKFLDYTLSKDGVEYITTEQAYGMERSQRKLSAAPAEAVQELAGTVSHELYFTVKGNYSLSPSDLFLLFRSYLLGEELAGWDDLVLYGPEHDFVSEEVDRVNVGEIKRSLAAAQFPAVFADRQLPDYFQVGNKRLSPLDITCTLAAIIREGLGDQEDVQVVKGVLKAEQHAGDRETWGNGWVIFPEDLRVPNIIRTSKLQTWTLKPALF